MNRTLQFGEGLFETIRWRGEDDKLKLHYNRLKDSAEFFGIPCPSYEEFLGFIRTAAGGDRELYVKFVLVSKGSSYYADSPDDYEVSVFVKELPKQPEEVSLTLSDFRRHSRNPIFRHKTTSYLFNVLVKREAREKGFFDAIVLNEKGELTECSASNLLILKGGKLYTPHRENGLLQGTTIQYLRTKGIHIEEVSLNLQDITSADSVFITNSLMGVVPVRRFMDTEIKVDTELARELKITARS
ncbi:aminotransferase class IV [Hydrogenivirga sp.]